MKASGALARPSAMLSRNFSLPCATAVPSSFSACGHTSMCSETIKPSMVRRDTRISCGFFSGSGWPS
ncbi:hypothetical protein D3C72_2103880 [compost metagenome]